MKKDEEEVITKRIIPLEVINKGNGSDKFWFVLYFFFLIFLSTVLHTAQRKAEAYGKIGNRNGSNDYHTMDES